MLFIKLNGLYHSAEQLERLTQAENQTPLRHYLGLFVVEIWCIKYCLSYRAYELGLPIYY